LQGRPLSILPFGEPIKELIGLRSGPMRRHVFYAGRVQGVGFRFTAQRIAQRFAVTGWVRNLPDGRVEMVVEGSDDEAEDFLNHLAESMADNIQSVQQHDEADTGEFSGFAIVQ
jgi:acylphosphatase